MANKLIKWVNSIITKVDENIFDGLPNMPPSSLDYSNFKTYFHRELKLKNDAQKEIDKLHPITQNLLNELKETNPIKQYSFNNFPPELEYLIIGKIIEKHIQQAIFNQKIENILKEDDDSK